jgi:hypothetical protein
MVATIRLGINPNNPINVPLDPNQENAMKPDHKPATPSTNTETKRTPVSAKLAEAIRRMDDLLQTEFGFDLAYCILAHGLIVAASNSRDGYVPPVVAPAANGGT